MEIKISDIKSQFSTRKLNQGYVDFLVKDFKEFGFKKSYPVSVTEDGILWDGNHRLEAAKICKIKLIPYVIETPENMRFEAHERNRIASNNLPETFVDHAEEIWGLLAEGMTQQAVADEMGCTQGRVAHFSKLEILCPNVWGIITGFSSSVIIEDGKPVINNITSVITEGLLRNILPLTEHYQQKIITELISDKIKNGQVKKLAKTYAERESFAEYAIDNLSSQEDTIIFFGDCINGLYATQQQIEKAVSLANDEYEKKNSIRILHGDCFEQLKKVKDKSYDALITDPPYSILKEDWDKFESQENFLQFTRDWLKQALPKIKETGRLYIFWPPSLHHLFPYNAIPEVFKSGINPLLWLRKNAIKPHNRKDYVMTYEFIFYFYGKDAAPLNLPKSAEWDKETNNLNVFEHAQPQTNFTDKKEHPAQKPIALMEEIVSVGTEIGDTILDCFAGAGTTGVACKKLKRKALLIEKEEQYIKIIKKRLS